MDWGTWSGGSLSSLVHNEEWALDQLGNHDFSKLDLDGDANFNETGERNDDRTHNVVNELTARDTDDDGSDDYTLTSDAAGNLTDDGEQYEYVYDAWNRLRKVKSRPHRHTDVVRACGRAARVCEAPTRATQQTLITFPPLVLGDEGLRLIDLAARSTCVRPASFHASMRSVFSLWYLSVKIDCFATASLHPWSCAGASARFRINPSWGIPTRTTRARWIVRAATRPGDAHWVHGKDQG